MVTHAAYQAQHAHCRREARVQHTAFLSFNACREQQAKQLLQELVGQLHQLTNTAPLQAVSHPAFWQLAQQASAGSLALSQDLQLLGYDLAAAASSAASELQQLQQLLGLDASELQQQLLRSGRVDASLLQPGQVKELLAAVSGDAAARQALAGLQLLQVLGQALGLSSVQLCSPISPCELLARLTGRQQQQRELGQDLQQQLATAAPQLLAAVQQLPAAALEQATVGSLLQLLSSKPELQVRDAAACLLAVHLRLQNTCSEPAAFSPNEYNKGCSHACKSALNILQDRFY
jgi:hypothetical protein